MTDNQPSVVLAEGETAAEPDAPLVPGAEPDLPEEDESGHDVHDTIAAEVRDRRRRAGPGRPDRGRGGPRR
jgi:hypothetical protein